LIDRARHSPARDLKDCVGKFTEGEMPPLQSQSLILQSAR
jgi:hypothetical protein